MKRILTKPFVLTGVATLLLVGCMLGLYENACAQQQRGNPPPFANSVDQRAAMVRELKEIKGLLREQNTLLRTLVTHVAKPANPANSNAAN